MIARRLLLSRVPRFDRRLTRVKLPAAVVGAVLVAEAAVWILRPQGAIEPDPVSESHYFSSAQLERAHDFSGAQRLLGFGTMAVQGAVLVLLIVRPPRNAVRIVEGAARGRALVAGAVLGAALAAAVQLAPLPLRAVAHQRAVDFGLSTQGWGGWTWDVAKATTIGVLLSAGGAALFLALMRRFPRSWWVGGAAAVVAIEIVFVWLGPVVLAPLFNRFERLPEGRIRSDVETLARRAGVDVGDVFVVDASRRTRRANAFVTGLGPTKRVVLYDTLIDRFTPAQTRLVVAHELGHVKNRDLARGMLWVALVAPLAMYVVGGLTARWAKRAGVHPGSPASLPAFALALTVVSFCASIVSNQLSRQVEARADTFALEITSEPRQFIEMEKELTVANLSDPDPPAPLVWLFATHPPAVDRIGEALAFERERR
jgi:STE24 endopeptidase